MRIIQIFVVYSLLVIFVGCSSEKVVTSPPKPPSEKTEQDHRNQPKTLSVIASIEAPVKVDYKSRTLIIEEDFTATEPIKDNQQCSISLKKGRYQYELHGDLMQLDLESDKSDKTWERLFPNEESELSGIWSNTNTKNLGGITFNKSLVYEFEKDLSKAVLNYILTCEFEE